MYKKWPAAILAAILPFCSAAPAAENGRPFEPVRATYGATFGTPAALNLSLGRYFSDKYGVRLSGGYFDGRGERYATGLQINILYKAAETRHGLLDLSLMAGYAEIRSCSNKPKYWRYMGGAVAGKWRFLFAEIGLSVGNGDYPNPQATLQFGFILFTERSKR